ncbi:MAG: carbamoyltransferase N-terminal domain-containing protein, partial [Thalassobaculaceae bacterium]|nr:carbamoyltransferase N-terminal domain-containing protein [Thalassobaculaceae bacterium]
MLIVGLNFAHDAGVCIVDRGRVLGLFQRERFTRVKRQAFLTADFLQFCLKSSGVDWKDVDHVAVTSSQSWPLILLDPDRLRIEHDASALDALPLKGVSADMANSMIQHMEKRRQNAETRYEDYKNPAHRFAEYFGPDKVSRPPDDGFAISYDWPVMPDWWQRPYTPADVVTKFQLARTDPARHYA